MPSKADLIIAQRAYDKALKRAGYNKETSRARKITTFSTDIETPVLSREIYPSLSTPGIVAEKLEDQAYKAKVSSQYVLGQAYNKGNFQVLGKKEEKDDATGKRR